MLTNTERIAARFPHLYDAAKAASNYVTSTIRHVATGSQQVEDTTYEQRRTTCNACEQRDPVADVCRLCKCPLHRTILGDKLRRATEKCPLRKW